MNQNNKDLLFCLWGIVHNIAKETQAHQRPNDSIINREHLDSLNRYTNPEKKKIAWIHTDYTHIWVNAEEELKVWSAYDYIASISSDVTNTFLKVFPSLSPQIIEIENILSPRFVRERADLMDVSQEMGEIV